MEDENEDDMYAPDAGDAPSTHPGTDNSSAAIAAATNAREENAEDEEEGEEVEEEESDSDIDIITERKGDPKIETLQAPRTTALKAAASPRTQKTEQATARKGSPAVKSDPLAKDKDVQSRLGSSYPAVKTSNIDVDAKPLYEPNGKPITEIDMDADFPEDDKPWRRPGTDMTDYFNYGFDEFTWASYCLKQTNVRKEVSDSKKQMEEMQNFLTMPGGMPPMPGMAAASAPPGMGAMGGPTDLPPEMQQMMQQMMAQGIDPMQMDPATVMQMMQQGAAGGGGGGGGDSNQNFGGQGYGQQGQNQQHMGYGGGGGGGGGGYGGGGRNAGGRGQGRRW